MLLHGLLPTFSSNTNLKSRPLNLYDSFMSQEFQPGDFLIFQLEAGYGLVRLLAIDDAGNDKVWHLAGYENLFMDVDSADAALRDPRSLTVSYPHLALTTRAFLSTQVARMTNEAPTETERQLIDSWRSDPNREVSDRSFRLLMGLR
jgi:hypothetical protein